jgi:O-antigen/teichoic acid export membrane protein
VVDQSALATPAASMPSLREVASRGALWCAAGVILSQMLRFGTNLVLTRLLVPELFGLMALAQVFHTGVTMCAELALEAAAVRRRLESQPAFLATAWTLQIARGGAIWLACALLAPAAAWLYDDQRLLWILPMIGLSSVIAGFNSTSLLTTLRELALGPLTMLELASQVLAIAVMVAWAWLSPTVWALVAGWIAAALVRLVLSFRLPASAPHRFCLDGESVAEILAFARWIMPASVLTFLAGQADRAILGKLFSLELLGVFGIAYALSQAPRMLISSLSNRVIYPAVVKLAELNELDQQSLRDSLLRARWTPLLLIAAGLAVLVGFGDLLVRVLFDQRYGGAAWMLPLLAAGIWPSVLASSMSPSLFAIRAPRYVTYGNLARLAFTVAALPLGYLLAGPLGAVAAVALDELPFYLPLQRGLRRHGLSSLGQDLAATAAFALLLTLLLAGRQVAGLGSPLAALELNP